MTTTTNVQQVKVNKVTQAQYDSMVKNDNEFYVIVDREYLDEITSEDVTTALGYTPYSSANPDGYITGITSGMVTSALGFTPYSNANPSGYQANVLEGVQINGTDLTITSKKVNIPLAGTDTIGVAKANAAYGVHNNSGTLTISKATDAQVTGKSSQYRPLTPYNIDLAVKTGVTTNTITLTDAEKTAAKDWLGISESGGANTDLSNLTSTGNNLVNTALNTRDNTTRLKFWTGTKAQYDAISTKDSNTLYNITDDQDITLTLLQTIYPVGSVYLSTNSTCPLASLFGTWTLVSSGKALWTGTGSNGGSTIEAGLPNITGRVHEIASQTSSSSIGAGGAFEVYQSYTAGGYGSSKSDWVDAFTFDASRSSPIYGNSTTVQPPAYVVNVWRRTA